MHPVTELLIARMDTHPEEFYDIPDEWAKWERILRFIEQRAPNEYALLDAKLQRIQLDGIHQDVIKKLCEGEGEQE